MNWKEKVLQSSKTSKAVDLVKVKAARMSASRSKVKTRSSVLVIAMKSLF